MINQKIIAKIIGVSFFFTWLGILYAGADHPAPPGFIVIIFFDLICSWVVYLRVSSYIAWFITRKTKRLLFVILDGLAAGFLVALIAMLLPGTGEPSVHPIIIDRLIFLVVLGLVGAANAVMVYSISTLLTRKFLPNTAKVQAVVDHN